MITAGIAIDNWKLPIFKRHLDAAGFEYTEHKGLTPTTMLLKVKTPSAFKLQPFVEAAQLECAKR
jgi:hypothetical protein